MKKKENFNLGPISDNNPDWGKVSFFPIERLIINLVKLGISYKLENSVVSFNHSDATIKVIYNGTEGRVISIKIDKLITDEQFSIIKKIIN